MDKLSTRVMALEGPDRDWDREIAHACGAEYGPKSGWCDNESGDYWTFEECALHYTASLDAAMSLVPEGCLWTMDSWSATGWAAGIWRPASRSWLVYSRKEEQSRAPALALCTAALKARGL